jgi:hypothetical protein
MSGADSPAEIAHLLKDVEREAGFKPTGNFAHADARVPAYYRCYYTGRLELPQSYDELKLSKGTKDGCSLDAKKYDIFFYPIEAVASGHAPITESLAQAPGERVATVVPHEDFHQQIRDLSGPLAEAAATLVGFLTGAAAEPSLSQEAQLFLQKALILNRYYYRLAAAYRAARFPNVAPSTRSSVSWALCLKSAPRFNPLRGRSISASRPRITPAWLSTTPIPGIIPFSIRSGQLAGKI